VADPGKDRAADRGQRRAPVTITLRRSPHGPIVNDVLGNSAGTPIAMWWAFLETENPILEGFYQLNRADTLGKMREAAAKVQAPGLNIVWANARATSAGGRRRSCRSAPTGSTRRSSSTAQRQADKLGFYPFSANPQQENPAAAISSRPTTSHRRRCRSPVTTTWPTAAASSIATWRPRVKWDTQNSQALQLDTTTDYGPRTLAPLLATLRAWPR
jgi:penicillin amidase